MWVHRDDRLLVRDVAMHGIRLECVMLIANVRGERHVKPFDDGLQLFEDTAAATVSMTRALADHDIGSRVWKGVEDWIAAPNPKVCRPAGRLSTPVLQG
jgi:hypothetical protein